MYFRESEDIFRIKLWLAYVGAAAMMVYGTNMNGWTIWKDSTGKTLDECIRQKEK